MLNAVGRRRGKYQSGAQFLPATYKKSSVVRHRLQQVGSTHCLSRVALNTDGIGKMTGRPTAPFRTDEK